MGFNVLEFGVIGLEKITVLETENLTLNCSYNHAASSVCSTLVLLWYMWKNKNSMYLLELTSHMYCIYVQLKCDSCKYAVSR